MTKISATTYSQTKSADVSHKLFKLMHKFFAIILIAWMNGGISTYTLPYIPNILRYGLFFIWLFFALMSNKKFLGKLITQIYPLLIFCLYLFLLSVFNASAYIDMYLKVFLYLGIVYTIFLYYFNSEHKRFFKTIVMFIFADCIYLAINTYVHLAENPLLARYLATGNVDTTATTYSGIGSYGYFYALVPIILLLSYSLMNMRKGKLVSLLLVIGFMSVLIKASFTISILFSFLFITWIVLSKILKKHSAIIFIVIVSAILLSKDVISQSLNKIALSDHVSYEVALRLRELSLFFSGQNIAGSDLGLRLSLYTSSIDAFKHNFLAGISASNNIFYTVGGHSAWLDMLGRFGLFSILFFAFLLKAYKYAINRVPEKHKGFVNMYWLYFICLGFINTLFFSNIFTIWLLFLPMAITYFGENNPT